MIVVYGSALCVCLASIPVGQAIFKASRTPLPSSATLATGFAFVMIVSSATVRLPGHGVAAGLSVICLVLASVAYVGGVPKIWAALGHGLGLIATLGFSIALASLPFLANARFGMLGVSINDDLSPHLFWADSLQVGRSLSDLIIPGYPLGPHSLAAAVSALLSTTVDRGFSGLTLAVPPLTAATAFGILPKHRPIARLVGSQLIALPYLAAAYFGQGAFKELIQALLLLGFVLWLRGLRKVEEWHAGLGVPPALLIAATVLVQSWPAIAWPIMILIVYIAAGWYTTRGGRLVYSGLWRSVKKTLPIGMTSLGVAMVALLPDYKTLLSFKLPRIEGGNLPQQLPPLEAVGVWFSPDFRIPPVGMLRLFLPTLLALFLVGYGCWWWWRRGDPLIPAAVVAYGLIYLGARLGQTGPYFSAKTLVVATPIVALMIVQPLLHANLTAPLHSYIAGFLALIALAALGCSTILALLNAHVGPYRLADELAPVRKITQGAPTLYLISDNFSYWKLRGADLSAPVTYTIKMGRSFQVRPEKDVDDPASFDFDSVPPTYLNHFRYVLTTRSAFSSFPPHNWHPLLSTPSYILWTRRGPTEPRAVLQEGADPGAFFSCGGPAVGSDDSSASSVAVVRTPPTHVTAYSWSASDPASPLGLYPPLVHLPERRGIQTTLTFPVGSWEISMQYRSSVDLRVIVGEDVFRMPANLDLIGPYWSVGQIDSMGQPLLIRVAQEDRGVDKFRPATSLLGTLVATRIEKPTTMPLTAACGRYVDWYRMSWR